LVLQIDFISSGVASFGLPYRFGGEEIMKLRAELDVLYRKKQELAGKLVSLGEDETERERRLDVYAFQLKEIRAAGLYKGEDDELLQKEKILANAEKICTIKQCFREK